MVPVSVHNDLGTYPSRMRYWVISHPDLDPVSRGSLRCQSWPQSLGQGSLCLLEERVTEGPIHLVGDLTPSLPDVALMYRRRFRCRFLPQSSGQSPLRLLTQKETQRIFSSDQRPGTVSWQPRFRYPSVLTKVRPRFWCKSLWRWFRVRTYEFRQEEIEPEETIKCRKMDLQSRWWLFRKNNLSLTV